MLPQTLTIDSLSPRKPTSGSFINNVAWISSPSVIVSVNNTRKNYKLSSKSQEAFLPMKPWQLSIQVYFRVSIIVENCMCIASDHRDKAIIRAYLEELLLLRLIFLL